MPADPDLDARSPATICLARGGRGTHRMKFLSTQLSYLLTQRETRRNLQALVRYLVFLAVVVTSRKS